MKISAAANVEVPAILALEAMGYTVASKVVSNDYEMVWRATCDGQEYVGEDPLSLLGLVKSYWKCVEIIGKRLTMKSLSTCRCYKGIPKQNSYFPNYASIHETSGL